MRLLFSLALLDNTRSSRRQDKHTHRLIDTKGNLEAETTYYSQLMMKKKMMVCLILLEIIRTTGLSFRLEKEVRRREVVLFK